MHREVTVAQTASLLYRRLATCFAAGGVEIYPDEPVTLKTCFICPFPEALFPRCMSFYDQLKFNDDGLIPAIVQEQSTGRVLMMAWMNRASIEMTIKSGKTHFWSRSRKKFWMKGETSGHTQAVKDIAFDCDGDTLLIQVEQIGAACHENYKSCFFRSVTAGAESRITEAKL